MGISEIKYFEKLKQSIVRKMQQSHPEVPSSISEWKGQTILSFQVELFEQEKENISEKWFYTHMKADRKKLPRIDTLNLLSRYAGYKSWDDFMFENSKQFIRPNETKDRSNRVFIVIPAIVLALLMLFYLAFSTIYKKDYVFLFIDNETNEPISSQEIELIVLDESQTNTHYYTDEKGSIRLKPFNRMLSIVVKSPYYHTDTIVRVLNKFNRHEEIKLRPDEYAFLIHHYSMNYEEDQQKRREVLNEMFSDSAVIYQVTRSSVGMDIYNKREFIETLISPGNNLNQIDVIDTKYRDDKIIQLRFVNSKD